MTAPLSLADSLVWLDPWLAPWFTAWGVPASRLEALAFVLSLVMVGLNLRVHVTAWPLAIVSSALYGLLFARSRLYGEASLQLVFIGLSAWGWWRWWRDPAQADAGAGVRGLTAVQRWRAAAAGLALWPVIGLMLKHATDSDVAFADAFPTALSLLGQWLLARKLVENWPCWLVVNLVSMALFAHKGLWLTVILYGLFSVLSVWGWRAWHQRLQEARA
ncbi:nicotinamide riboside transporter PnuC [uncultured Aquabacterium sp.]|jgi:nicotinamide mononucleotide transporter|uniref:nicotinamide riboside transporter PnuC n=1 Tax=uncultured Aquabacterium sp. TaxID=158753 RepID=UPI00262F9D44|nr:nicotinamide riboside transporter PnuC [uncultured Aquabacterium sp.]